MKKAIPFMTDDELMELLAENMNVYFEDYEEIENGVGKAELHILDLSEEKTLITNVCSSINCDNTWCALSHSIIIKQLFFC